MRFLAILAIHAYRLFLRRFHRRVCLYEESCSAYGLRVFRHEGFLRGLALTRARVHSCRLPTGACFVLEANGRAALLSSTVPMPPAAIRLLAAEAESTLARREGAT